MSCLENAVEEVAGANKSVFVATIKRYISLLVCVCVQRERERRAGTIFDAIGKRVFFRAGAVVEGEWIIIAKITDSRFANFFTTIAPPSFSYHNRRHCRTQ